MQSDDVLQRYQRVRQITVELHAAAMKHLARTPMLQHARRLGLTCGSRIVATEEELHLLFDLAIHGGQRGRPRPIDRCKAPADDPQAAAVLAAIRTSRFSVFTVDRHHHVAGVVLRDSMFEEEVWLMDIGIAASWPPGRTFASRIFWPAEFAITCGIVVPVDIDTVMDTIDDCARWLAHDDRGVCADPRFAAALYRNAIALGDMEDVEYRPVTAAA